MNLALDATYSLGNELSGVGVYSRQLLITLARAHPEQEFRWLYRPHRILKAYRDRIPTNVRRGILWDHAGFRQGLFHGLNQRLPQRRYPRQIVTFHDLFILTGEYSTPEFRKRFTEQARHAAAKADCLIAVSQFTADQMHDLLGVERARIRVVHHGVVNRKFRPLPREKLVLSVGAIQTRKNTARLIQAFRAIPDDWRLVLAGSAGFEAEQQLSGALNPRITIAGYLSGEELTDLYSRASLFAFPSLDEGFGMPILEAMAAGIPVITSNRSAMPEIAGGAARLVDPFEIEEIATALNELAHDDGARADLVQKGLKRAATFTWERAAQETWAIYQELT